MVPSRIGSLTTSVEEKFNSLKNINMFEKNLQDLVKGIRSSKSDANIYISKCIQEIKNELKNTDPFLKAEAIRKLTYLSMMAYDMSWACFNVVEVMSYERFAHKRVGYLAASQSFTESTDVILLCTNLLKKEFGSLNEFEVGLAINCLSNIVTKDLARDLLGDVVAMIQSPSPYIRKKAVLVMYKLYLRYPQGLRLTFERLKERTEEDDVSVVSSAVNVICELANKKPKNYLGLAPTFFRLLTTSSNNWMLIKVVKLMASLVPEEPRLARKLLDPLATIIQNTPAKSLLYECISTVTTCLIYTRKSDGGQPRNVPAVVRLCNDHLRRYIEDSDQNLMYLGLVGLQNLMKSHPFVVTDHQEIILECLSSEDMTIRLRALELVTGMITPENSKPIIRKLMYHAHRSDGTYRDELIRKILDVCSAEKYTNVEDFEWYIHILVDLSHLQGLNHGKRIASQLIDISIRVETARDVAVENMIALLSDASALSQQSSTTMEEVLYAAAWIVGEFGSHVEDEGESSEEENDDEEDDEDERPKKPKRNPFEKLVDDMLQPRTTSLPPHVQAVYMQAVLKLLATAANVHEGAEGNELCQSLGNIIMERLHAFLQSEHVEVQERAVSLRQLLLALGLGLDALPAEERAAIMFDRQEGDSDLMSFAVPSILASYFDEPLAPVNPKAQSRVPVPQGLDLDTPINPEATEFMMKEELDALEDDGYTGETWFSTNDRTVVKDESYSQYSYGEDSLDNKDNYLKEYQKEDSSLNAADFGTRMDKRTSQDGPGMVTGATRSTSDPFYLKSSSSKQNRKKGNRKGSMYSDEEDRNDTDIFKTGKKTKKKKKSSRKHTVNTEELMPSGFVSDPDSRRSKSKSKSAKLLEEANDLSEVDLSVPLGSNEQIPMDHLFHRTSNVASEEKKERKKSKKHKKRSKKEGFEQIDEEKQSELPKHKKRSKKKEEVIDLLGEEDLGMEETKHDAVEDRNPLKKSSKQKSSRKSHHKKDKKSGSHASKVRDDEEENKEQVLKKSSKKSKKKSKDKENRTSKVSEEPLLLL